MNACITILRKVQNDNFQHFDEIVTGRNPFGVPAKDKELEKYLYKSKEDDHNVSIRCAYEREAYTGSSIISRGHELASLWKIFISKMNGGAGTLMDAGTVAILGKAYIGSPNSICSNALIAVGPFSTEFEVNNVQKYLSTKFCRFMVGIMKSSQVLTKNVYKFVPMQDFISTSDIDWSKPISDIDKQLYAKYELSEDEISFIEEKIKPME